MAFDNHAVATSSARTTSGNSAAFRTGLSRGLTVVLDVTASGGTTPNLVCEVEWSMDGTIWASGGDTFTANTAVSRELKSFVVKAPFYRIKWTVSGTTPSFTFTANGYTTG